MEFAKARFELMKEAGDGSAIDDHMASVRAQTSGVAEAATPDLPTVEPELFYLWDAWRELNCARQSGGMASNPVSYLEIEAYCRIVGVQFEPWEARAIRAVDDTFLAVMASKDTADG